MQSRPVVTEASASSASLVFMERFIRLYSCPAGFTRSFSSDSARSVSLRNQLDPVDLRILNVTRKHDFELPIRHFHRHRFDVGAPRPASFHPHIKVLELMPVETE